MRRAGCSPPGSAATKRLGLPDRLAHGGIDLSRGGDLLDPVRGFELWRSTADRLQAWYDGGKEGPRPFGRILPRHMELSGALKARWVPPLCRLAIDPDGRMLRLQREGEL